MEIKEELECPNCKKTIQLVQFRRPYIKRKKRKRGATYRVVKAVRKWIVKPT